MVKKMLATVRTWTAIIPLREGSKGLPGKNTRCLAGRPLYQHSVEAALQAGASRVILSTDIAAILEASLPKKTETLKRPADLATDSIEMSPVLAHAIENAGIQDTIVLLQATSPLRLVSDITDGLASYSSGKHELVMSVTEAERGVLKWGLLDDGVFRPLSDPTNCFANRQALPAVYRPNGAIYVFDADWFMKKRSLATDRIGVVVMPAERSKDIDTLADFEEVEYLLSHQS
jgi:N-acylneuraminate cytidylyltransferase